VPARGPAEHHSVVYLRPDAGHGEAVLAHGTITSSLRARADLALAADAVPETNGASLGTRCEVGPIARPGLGAPRKRNRPSRTYARPHLP
jgi:hypothetical protein